MPLPEPISDFLGKFSPHFHFGPGKDEIRLKLVEKLKDSMCFFQGHFLEYSLVASNKHKALRKCIESSNCDVEKVFKLVIDFRDYYNQSLREAFDESVKELIKIYQLRGKCEQCNPRICLKGIIFDDKIFDVFRNITSDKWEPFSIDENTGFERVLTDGKSFLCNDIPREVIEGRYKNLRISTRHARDYKTPFTRRLQQACDDEQWEKCWDVDRESKPSPDSCYKSTLIVPLTLTNNRIGVELKNILNMVDNTHRGMTVAFLCLDHRTTEYFDKEDELISYFFADFLSLYMFNRINYVDTSDTFSKARKLLSEHELYDDSVVSAYTHVLPESMNYLTKNRGES